MLRFSPTLLTLLAVSLAGCADLPSGLVDVPPAAAGPSTSTSSVTVTLKVYAPATQVALIAAGGLNYRLSARADEAPVPGARVTAAGGGSAITDTTGRAKLTLPADRVNQLTVSYKLKGGSTVSLPALAITTGNARSVDLDAANMMLAAGHKQAGKSAAATALAAALEELEAAVAGASAVPTFTDEAGAASAFDELAPASVKQRLTGSEGQLAVVGMNGATYRVPTGGR